jgi:hypothetical protein
MKAAKNRSVLFAIASLAVAALILPAAAVSAGAEQIVIPLVNDVVPIEFDDPCTGEAVHGTAIENGFVHITELGDRGHHVRLKVDGVVDLYNEDDDFVGTWTYRLIFTDQFPPGGQGAAHQTATGPLVYADGHTAVVHVYHHHVFAKGDVERKPERNTASCGGRK